MKRSREVPGEMPEIRGTDIRFLLSLRGALALTLAFWGGPLVVLAVDEQRPLPEETFPLLEQILRDSADHSRRMIEEGLRVEEARAEAQVSAAGKYPSVAGTFRYLGRIEDRDDFGDTRSFYQPQATLIARQPLYHWGALEGTHRIGQLRAAMAEGNRAEAYRMLVLAIRSGFLQLAVRQKSVDLAGLQEELAQQELSVAKARFERDEITEDELRGIQLGAEEARLRLERARAEREFAVLDFSRLTGFAPAGEEWRPTEVPAVRTGGNQLISGDQRPGLRFRPWEDISRLRILQAEEQWAVESVRMRPRIDLVAGVAQDQVAVFDRADIDRTVYFAGVELTWNLFDGYETRGRKAAALARQRLEKRRHERQEIETTAELERLEHAVAWSARDLALSEERLELARRDLSQKEKDLERGLISEVEMAGAEVAFAERELAANRRRAEYLMAVSEYLSLAGLDPAMEFYRNFRF